MKPDKAKILLIRPQNIYGLNNYPSLGLLSVATSLHDAGYDVQILQGSRIEILTHLFIAYPQTILMGMTMMTAECLDAYRILRQIRFCFPNMPIVAGGWHCRLFTEQMAESPLVDYVIFGEGEKEIVALADHLATGTPTLEEISNPQPDINGLPIVRYDLDPNIEQFITGYLTDMLDPLRPRPRRWLPYESSRGCPSQCTFCANVVANNTHYRAKNATKTATEMAHIASKYKIDHIKIIDDNFFADIKRVRQICEMLLMLKVNVTWDAECRADYFRQGFLDDQTLHLCKQAGLVQLTIGIESGSQASLDRMKKHLTVEQAEYAVSQCDAHMLMARCSFIIEIPGESKDQIEATRRFINRLRRYRYFTCAVQTFRPYPKCELTQGLVESGQWSEPQTFEAWSNPDYVRQFTAAQNTLPWQIQPKRSECMASYQSIESGIGLDEHMLSSRWDKFKCRIFKLLARWRNRLNWYGLPIDLLLYRRFSRRFLRQQEASWRK